MRTVDKTRERSFLGGWLVPLAISLAIVAWGMLLLVVIGNEPRY